MVSTAARSALSRISPPVWRVLAHSLLFGLAMSVADLLFNFYLASMGYAADVAGLLSTVTRGAGMLVGIPMGMLIDRLGPQRAMILGLLGYAAGWALLLASGALWVLVLGQFVVGAAFILVGTAVTPLLSTITSDAERSTVFGLNASAALIVGLLGSLLGGLLPGLVSGLLRVGPQDLIAYRFALAAVIALSLAAMLPLLGAFRPTEEPRLVGQQPVEVQPHSLPRLLLLSLPAFTLGVAGGLFLPFQNLYFRLQFGLDDAAVGVALAVGALGMGLGALLGSSVAARVGLQRGAALLRSGAIVAMLLMLVPALGPALVGFFLRGLFVAASFPQMDALVMRHTSPAQRGLAMSMMSVLWSGGWAFAAFVSGLIQIRWGFGPVIIAATIFYVYSTLAILALPLEQRRQRS
jgi:MFS family permease